MQNMERRSFLGAVMAAFPLALMGQSTKTSTPVRVARVPSGEDRFGEHHTLGVSSTDFKVSTQDSSGGLFIMEHTNRKKGGPPRHLHHNEDEWFYAVEGEYIVEVGSERFRLKSGDSVLGPREVPHVWAFVGDTPGKMLIAFAPANKMEAFFREGMKRHDNAYSSSANANDKEFFRAYGMELLGPHYPWNEEAKLTRTAGNRRWEVAKACHSGFPEPLPTRWFKRLRAATSIFATFRPLFRPRQEMVSQYTF